MTTSSPFGLTAPKTQTGAIGAPPQPAGDAKPVNELLPLAPQQESLWLSEQIITHNPRYNVPEAWRIQGHLFPAGLLQAAENVAARHEALRTTFVPNSGGVAQVVQQHVEVQCPLVDLSQCAAPEEELNRLLRVESSRPFHLNRAPLFRMMLFRLSSQDHVLFLNFHHLIVDAWSVNLFLFELREFYTAWFAGRPCALEQPDIQFADYVLWHKDALENGVFASHAKFWQEYLAGAPVLDLPCDHPRPAKARSEGKTRFVNIPGDTIEGLRKAGLTERATPYMVLLAGFNAFLHRLTRQEDIVLGTPLAGRIQPECEKCIGMFVQTHAIRTVVQGEMRFRDLVRGTRTSVTAVAAHQEIPSEVVRRELRAGAAPVVFGMQPAVPEWILPEAATSRLETENGGAKFDWTVLITEQAGEWQIRSEHNRDVLEESTVDCWIEAYLQLLRSAAENPDARISDLALLSEAQAREMETWGFPECLAPLDRCVHELFEEQALRTPNAVALSQAGWRMTYAELNKWANTIAWELQARGVAPESFVGVCLDRSPELIATLLAILKAGGAYVPLDRGYPRERLQFMLQDARVQVLVTNRRFESAGVCFDADRTLFLEELGDEEPPPGNLPKAAAPSNAAYVMYTSGSTGTPKGVIIPHRGIVRLVQRQDYVSITPSDTFLQFAPVSFDASTLEIWGPLLNGARLEIMPPQLPGLDELGNTLRREKVSVLWLTAGLFHQMVDHQLESLAGVKQLLAGGDVLSPTHVRKVVAAFPQNRLINGYGPTENTTFTCCYTVTKDWPGNSAVPIGRPISQTIVFVLDEKLNPVPPGMPGELLVGGEGLARGYANRPELTLEKFIVCDPGNRGRLVRLYRTGDLVRWRPDHTLEFLGRRDQQVKVRGFRVELGEVEAVLNRHPAVSQSVAVAFVDPAGNKQLAAYYVPRPEGGLQPPELMEFLRAHLPAHMVPLKLVPLPELPLTPNGKVNRRALPPIQSNGLETVDPALRAQTPGELLLEQIWGEVLGRRQISIDQNFFDLGGHSLLAMQVSSRIAQATGIDFPVHLVFEAKTIRQLARLLEDLRNQSGSSQLAQEPIARISRSADVLAHLDELTEAEIDELLRNTVSNHGLS